VAHQIHDGLDHVDRRLFGDGLIVGLLRHAYTVARTVDGTMGPVVVR
jgi:hypothetical protein